MTNPASFFQSNQQSSQQPASSSPSGLDAIGAFFQSIGPVVGWLANPTRIIKLVVGITLVFTALVVTFLPDIGAAAVTAAGAPELAGAAREAVRGRPRRSLRAGVGAYAQRAEAVQSARAVERDRERERARRRAARPLAGQRGMTEAEKRANPLPPVRRQPVPSGPSPVPRAPLRTPGGKISMRGLTQRAAMKPPTPPKRARQQGRAAETPTQRQGRKMREGFQQMGRPDKE